VVDTLNSSVQNCHYKVNPEVSLTWSGQSDDTCARMTRVCSFHSTVNTRWWDSGHADILVWGHRHGRRRDDPTRIDSTATASTLQSLLKIRITDVRAIFSLEKAVTLTEKFQNLPTCRRFSAKRNTCISRILLINAIMCKMSCWLRIIYKYYILLFVTMWNCIGLTYSVCTCILQIWFPVCHQFSKSIFHFGWK
jgi:hypothetical protein